MIALGIESTAHTFGIGIVNDRGEILSNIVSRYHSPDGGLKPFEASEHHYKHALEVLQSALSKARLSLDDIELISFSKGPGMGQCLRIGAVLARSISLKYGKPIVGVNHCLAHVEISRLITKFHDPLVVYASGVNTQLIAHLGDRYIVLGETQDMGLGNAQDKLGRVLGISPPIGKNMDEIKGSWIDLPYTVKGMDLAFSGLLTEAIKRFRDGARVEDICYSFQEVAFSMLVEVAERALAHTGKKELVLTGGVAASNRLAEKLKIMCDERNALFGRVTGDLARDNGAMIAWLGIMWLRAKGRDELESTAIRTKWRIDQVRWPLVKVGDV